MPALSDPKLEAFSRYLLRNIAKGMAKGKAADSAAREAGYGGSSLSANARKRANRKDVKARMAEIAEELATPEQKQARIDLAIDLATAEQTLWRIITTPIVVDEMVTPKDVVNAFRALAAVRAWNAPTTINENVNVNYAIGDQPPTEDEWASEHVTAH